MLWPKAIIEITSTDYVPLLKYTESKNMLPKGILIIIGFVKIDESNLLVQVLSIKLNYQTWKYCTTIYEQIRGGKS
jgi:hypothetical protein